jgi:hypothetical protein
MKIVYDNRIEDEFNQNVDFVIARKDMRYITKLSPSYLSENEMSPYDTPFTSMLVMTMIREHRIGPENIVAVGILNHKTGMANCISMDDKFDSGEIPDLLKRQAYQDQKFIDSLMDEDGRIEPMNYRAARGI